MSETAFFVRGLVIGFSIAAPVGPIGVLCLRRTLAEGRLIGLLTGLGAATADAFFGGIAGFGLTAVSSFLIGWRFWLRLVGGFFLCYLGVRTFMTRPALQTLTPPGSGGDKLLGAYFTTLCLTLTNPMTIIAFTAVFAGLGLGTVTGDYRQAGLTVAGVFTGSSLWWLLLSSAASRLRARLNGHGLRWVNIGSGTIVTGFGLAALISLF